MFKKISPESLSVNPFKALGQQWMLITAGTQDKCNTMTASWGGFGVLWNKNTATCYIRPQRYTLEFVDSEEYFSLCFFPEQYRRALALCGRKSGRDCDKLSESGLSAAYGEKAPYFEEAETVFICRKIYRQQLDPNCFIDSEIGNDYPDADYHFMIIGEIIDCFVKEA